MKHNVLHQGLFLVADFIIKYNRIERFKNVLLIDVTPGKYDSKENLSLSLWTNEHQIYEKLFSIDT